MNSGSIKSLYTIKFRYSRNSAGCYTYCCIRKLASLNVILDSFVEIKIIINVYTVIFASVCFLPELRDVLLFCKVE